MSALVAGAFLAAAAAAVPGAPPAARPADHVFVLMFDGTRPDVLRLADTPAIDGLVREGVTYLQARTIYPSQTRVAFVSLPTGSYTGSHGIVGGDDIKDENWKTVAMGNDDPIASQALCLRPTFFEDTTAAGLTSLYAAMKGYELVGARGATWTINGKKTLDPEVYASRYDREAHGSRPLAVEYKRRLSRELMDQVLKLFRQEKPNLVVMNVGSADYVAHAYGPLGEDYRRTLEVMDGLVAHLLEVLEEMGLAQRTAIIISADHGFSALDPGRVISHVDETRGTELPLLTKLGIEHYLSNTGGRSMGVYVRDTKRVPEVVKALRAEPWVESIYCEDVRAACDRSLSSLHAWAPGRSPQVMVDLDDDAVMTRPRYGSHGSFNESDSEIPLILSGAGVQKGLVLGRAELVDIAPTVLKLLGVEPTHLKADGHVLEEALAN